MLSEPQRNLMQLINGDKFQGNLKGNSISNGKYFYRNGDVYEGTYFSMQDRLNLG